jgi:hypothetical protein
LTVGGRTTAVVEARQPKRGKYNTNTNVKDAATTSKDSKGIQDKTKATIKSTTKSTTKTKVRAGAAEKTVPVPVPVTEDKSAPRSRGRSTADQKGKAKKAKEAMEMKVRSVRVHLLRTKKESVVATTNTERDGRMALCKKRKLSASESASSVADGGSQRTVKSRKRPKITK